MILPGKIINTHIDMSGMSEHADFKHIQKGHNYSQQINYQPFNLHIKFVILLTPNHTFLMMLLQRIQY